MIKRLAKLLRRLVIFLCFNNYQVRSGWSQLTPELLQEIVFLLPDISDLARFRAVCTAWRSAVYTTRAPKPSCNPCLLLMSYAQRNNAGICNTCTLSLVSCSFSDNCANVRQVGAVWRRVCGTGNGWLVVVSDLNQTTFEFSIFLLNPLTGFRIYLPSSASLVTPKSSSDIRHAYGVLIAAIRLLEGSKSPVSGCVVMITWYEHRGFSFCRYTGENHECKWTTVEAFSPHDYTISLAYHQGQGTILAHHAAGKVLLVDTASLSRTLVYLPPLYAEVALSRCATSRIVEASGEVFLAVYWWNETVAYVFRLDLTVQPPSWCLTTDIGDHVLFIDFSQLQCVTMQDHVKLNLRKNCIYSLKS